ncbi:MAG: hypothetical protein ABR521_11725 [Gaiellaceae bacterium]
MRLRPLSLSKLPGLGLLVLVGTLLGGAQAAPLAVYPGGTITIVDCCNNAGAETGPASKASPYPATIVVPNTVTGEVGEVRATVVLDHAWPDDFDLLLVGPSGDKVMLTSDAGSTFGNAIVPDTLTFAAVGTTGVPDNQQLESGTYDPTNGLADCDKGETGADDGFPAPAPPGPHLSGGAALSVFNGKAAAGTWKLYAIDDCSLGNTVGSSIASWSLAITTGPPTAVLLKSFTAGRTKTGAVLRWRTAVEANVLGFHVYRTSAGKRTKVTTALIRAKGGATRGAAYALVDRRAGRGAAQYRLQIVTLEGRRSWSAPASLRARR